MKRLIAVTAAILCSCLNGVPANAQPRVNPQAAEKFVTAPDGVRFLEGITVNPRNGDIYVATFDPGVANFLLRYGRNGRLEAMRSFGPEPLLDILYDVFTDAVYIVNVGVFAGNASRIQRIAADFDSATPVEEVAEIPVIGAPPGIMIGNPDGSSDEIIFGNNVPVPNALALDGWGNLYVSDSFQGALFKIANVAGDCPGPGCTVETLAHDGRLATTGHPPFGANGLALNADETMLYVANTGDDRILAFDLYTKSLSVFAESINGADGLATDEDGNLWVAANQADRVLKLDANGKVVMELGAFLGMRRDGSPRGLLFPASLAFAGNTLYVTNLAIALTPAANDEPEEQVSRWTVSRMHIPRSQH